MRKSSSNSSGDSGPGKKNTFKKDDGGKSPDRAARPSFKKNYDGRSPSSGDGRPSRPSKPYSGRVADGDKPDRPFGKPSFDKDSKSGSRPSAGGKPRKDFDKPRSADPGSRPFADRPKRSFDKSGKPGDKDRTFGDRPKARFDKPSFGNEEGGAGKRDGKSPRNFDKPGSRASGPSRDRPKPSFDRPAFNKEEGKPGGDSRSRPAGNKSRPADSRPFRDRPKPAFGKPGFDKDAKSGKPGKRDHVKPSFKDVMDQAFNAPKTKKKEGEDESIIVRPQQFEDQVFGELEDSNDEEKPKRSFEKKKTGGAFAKKKFVHDHSEGRKKKYKDEDDDDDDDLDEEDKEINQTNGPRLEMPLNKFIAHSGECSRRDAAALVRQGKVKVNEELVLDPGYRVKHDDKVTMSGKKLTPQKGMVYILLNKPKGFITTNDDPQGRKTVMELVASSGVDRLFPVGRLDRDTSGLLLITNDGELTQKLCHPSYAIKKVYQVTTDKPVTNADFEKILAGVDLEDGIAHVDALSYLEKKNELGLEIHSGRNRIVRRIFESLGYVVEKLDRVMYAGLTKKNLPRSKWRFLDEREVVLLKHFKS